MKSSNITKVLTIFLALAMVLSLAACGGGDESSTPGQNDNGPGQNDNPPSQDDGPDGSGQTAEPAADVNTKLTIGFNSSVTTLDPFNNENAYLVLDMLYMMLFVRDGFGGELQYGIANGYEQKDEFTYVISIRDDVVDSKGNPITAEDVAWSYNYCRDNGSISKASYVESCEVTGENQVTLKLNASELDLFQDVTTSIWVVSKATYESCDENMVMEGFGSTGYKVVSFKPGSELVITRTDEWWGEDCDDLAAQYARNVGTIEVDFITEASQLQTGLETGTLQMAFQVNSLYSADFMETEGYNVYSIPSNTPMELLFNCTEDSVCSDVRIRQAIACCIDRQTIVNSVTYGMGVALKSLGSDIFSGYQSSWDSEDYYDYNIERAKELLAEAGYDGEKIRFMVVAQNNNQNTAASVIQAACIEAGMNVVIDNYEMATFNSYRNAGMGMYDMFLGTAASSAYMASFFRYYLDAEQYGGATINGVVDGKLQELVETAGSVETMSDESIDELHQYVKDNCYQIGVIAVSRDCVYVDGIESVYLTGHAQIAPNASVLSGDWDILAN